MGSEHENPGGFAPVRKRETLEKNNNIFEDKAICPEKNESNLYKKTIFCTNLLSHSAWSAWI